MTDTPEPSRRPIWMYETPSPRSSYSELADIGMLSHPTKGSDLVGVLEQVSQLTMEDDAFTKSDHLRTPFSLNPRPVDRRLSMFEDDWQVKPPLSSDIKQCNGRDRSSTPSKLMTAPPLPSSPDLSMGGRSRCIPPQFSPLGSSHEIDIGPLIQQRNMMMEADDMSVSSVEGFPKAPPPTPQVTSLPPPMPWIETPEQVPRKRLMMNHLQMKKGAFFFS